MTDPAIEAALREAGEAVRQSLVKPPCCMEGTGCELPPCHCAQVAAAIAVEAFLRALPTVWVRDTYGSDEAIFKNLLHEKVARAAKEGD
jgi:hypothetical protein